MLRIFRHFFPVPTVLLGLSESVVLTLVLYGITRSLGVTTQDNGLGQMHFSFGFALLAIGVTLVVAWGRGWELGPAAVASVCCDDFGVLSAAAAWTGWPFLMCICVHYMAADVNRQKDRITGFFWIDRMSEKAVAT